MIWRILPAFLLIESGVAAATFVPTTTYAPSLGRHVQTYTQFDGVSLSGWGGETDDYPSSRFSWRGSLAFASSVDLSIDSMNLSPGDRVDHGLFNEVLGESPELSVAVRKSYRIAKIPRQPVPLGDGSPSTEEYSQGFVLDDVQVQWSTPFNGLNHDWVSKPKDTFGMYPTHLLPSGTTTRHVGFREERDGQFYFGWFEVLASERGFRLGRLFVSDRPDEPVRVTNVPEPNPWPWGLIALTLPRKRQRHAAKQR